jgi:hypothetical protein
MAKLKGTSAKMLVSKDNITFYTVPVDSTTPTFTGDTLDATTLADAKYKSMLKGLKGATFSGNIKTKASTDCGGMVGYKTVVKISGTGIESTGEAFTNVSGKMYKITADTKNLWDRGYTPVIYDDAVEVDADDYTIDYMFGIVKFADTYTVAGAITADVKYLPTTVVAARTGYSLSQKADVNDVTDLNSAQANGGWKSFDYGRRTVDLTLDGFYDTVADNFSFFTSDAPVVVEVNVGGNGLIARGWFYVTGDTQAADGDKNIGENLTCALSSGCTDGQAFSWNVVALGDNTIIDQGTFIMLDAFVNGTKPYVKAMLSDDDGIGYSFRAVVGDMSASGSAGDVEKMSLNLTADGAVTEL